MAGLKQTKKQNLEIKIRSKDILDGIYSNISVAPPPEA